MPWPLALADLPMAMAAVSVALAWQPKAMAYFSVASLLDPMAMAESPAFAEEPIANAQAWFACDDLPMAIALVPVALALVPMARELWPWI